MTPARIAEIAESAWLHPQSQPLDVAIERAIRLAVNEVLEEAMKAADSELNNTNVLRIYPPQSSAAQKIRIAIRALKLPEE